MRGKWRHDIGDLLSQSNGVARRMSTRVVVEVCKNVQSVRGARSQPFGPVVQAFVRIPASILLSAEVKPHIDERTHNEPAGGGTVHVLKTQRDVVATQQPVNPVVIPARFAKFDGVTVAAR